ncbi:hypothetical protein YC2023_080675 [Brassica napus]
MASDMVDHIGELGGPIEACKLFGEVETYDIILLNSMVNVYISAVEELKTQNEWVKSDEVPWNSVISD